MGCARTGLATLTGDGAALACNMVCSSPAMELLVQLPRKAEAAIEEKKWNYLPSFFLKNKSLFWTWNLCWRFFPFMIFWFWFFKVLGELVLIMREPLVFVLVWDDIWRVMWKKLMRVEKECWEPQKKEVVGLDLFLLIFLVETACRFFFSWIIMDFPRIRTVPAHLEISVSCMLLVPFLSMVPIFWHVYILVYLVFLAPWKWLLFHVSKSLALKMITINDSFLDSARPYSKIIFDPIRRNQWKGKSIKPYCCGLFDVYENG